MRPYVPLEVRFERHVDRDGAGGCWLWRGSIASSGYGQMRVGRRGPCISVHRWAYEYFKGPVPDGLLVLHTCDVKHCCNPGHLYAGTQAQNTADAVARGRRAKKYKFGSRVRKLTDDDVRTIRVDERPVHVVAAAYGVAEVTVFNVRARRRKGHVPDVAEVVYDERPVPVPVKRVLVPGRLTPARPRHEGC